MYDIPQSHNLKPGRQDSYHHVSTNLFKLHDCIVQTNNEVDALLRSSDSIFQEKANIALENSKQELTNLHIQAQQDLTKIISQSTANSDHIIKQLDTVRRYVSQVEVMQETVKTKHDFVETAHEDIFKIVNDAVEELKTYIQDEINLMEGHANSSESFMSESKRYSEIAKEYSTISKEHSVTAKNQVAIMQGMINDFNPEFDDSHLATKTEVNLVNTNVTNLEGRVRVLETTGGSGGDDVDHSIFALKTEVQALDVTVKDQAEALKGFDSDLDGFETALTRFDTALDDTETSIIALEASTGLLKTSLEETNTNVATLQETSETLSTDLTEVSTKVTINLSDIEFLKTELAKAIDRIVELEKYHSDIPVDPNPKKFYVLPLGGQSNMVGFGEVDARTWLNETDSRIKQIPRFNNLKESDTLYGERHIELRTVDDQGLIPATPCLDNHENMFTKTATPTHGRVPIKGTGGVGLFLAKKLLPYIPNDYGILLVPVAHGGTGFYQNGDGEARWGIDTELGLDFLNRTKQAMAINPENKLLPIIWQQGESDTAWNGPTPETHRASFNTYFNWFKESLRSEGILDRLVGKYRWIHYTPTKWMMGSANNDTLTNYITQTRDYSAACIGWTGASPLEIGALYDNYAYNPEMISVRTDIDLDGLFCKTNNEEGTGYTSSTKPLHYASSSYRNVIAELLANAMLTKCNITDKPYTSIKKNRNIRGSLGSVVTDNSTFEYDNNPTAFDTTEGLMIHQDFTINSDILHNLAPVEKNIIQYGNPVVSNGAISFTGTQCLKYYPDHGDSYTYIVKAKMRYSDRMQDSKLLSGYDGSDAKTNISVKNGGVIAIPNGFGSASMLTSKCLFGAWEGDFEDWQVYALTYDANSKQSKLYLNGCLIESHTGAEPVGADVLFLGAENNISKFFKGDVASIHVYNKALSLGEINYL